MSAARRAFRPIRATAFAVWSVSAASLACSGGGGTDVARAGDVITGAEDLGRIEGRVTIGPLCPVERIPPDPTCQPTPETFAAVKLFIDNFAKFEAHVDQGVKEAAPSAA